ncbi:MAG: hypothetical protein WC377_06715 [Bacteroidales bacterium]|jgi:hypothetical protein|nr:hypothetical protein [Bacteroidales bacterium]MDD3100586.1 hypothetical protein [Bacteroidales bacterium]MDD3639882.1 hypothetical protein [Bacteroidales bacterium]MDD4481079.1 hypothetical protein [Bacteroidales bacterium]MDD5313792.1 hypothetical protein [Bacteroidales bacterium]
MKRFFTLLLMFAGLFAVSCASGYKVASSAYDDATYFRPDVTARVHLLASAEEAEQLRSETIALARQEGTRVETVYTDPDGVVDIEIEPGTKYLVMHSTDDSYARKLEMFDDQEDDFSLTINLTYAPDMYPYYSAPWLSGWYNSWFRPWYSPWYRYSHIYRYRPFYGMFDPWYFSPYGNYMPYDWYHHYYSWYYNDFYYGWPYAYGYMGYGGYPWGYAHNNYRPGPDTPYRERENLRRIAPERQIASNNVRSGGSYRRTNPQIDQISGNRTERTRDIDNRTGIRTESGTTNYRRVNGNSGTDAVYRDPSSNTRSRTGESVNENTFYRRSSNLSQGTRDNTRTGSSSGTTNPGNSRSFYRGTQKPSATVNPESSGSSRSRTTGSSSVNRSTGSDNNRSFNRTGSSSTVSRSSGSVSSGSMRSSGSGSMGSSGGGGSTSRSGSGGSYRR